MDFQLLPISVPPVVGAQVPAATRHVADRSWVERTACTRLAPCDGPGHRPKQSALRPDREVRSRPHDGQVRRARWLVCASVAACLARSLLHRYGRRDRRLIAEEVKRPRREPEASSQRSAITSNHPSSGLTIVPVGSVRNAPCVRARLLRLLRREPPCPRSTALMRSA
jgi:hypothetical protein